MRLDYPRALLGVLAAVCVLALVVAASTSTVAFGVYNSAWDGAGELQTVATDGGATATVALNTSAYEETNTNETVALVLSPDEPYGEEAERLRRFVEAGGTLVIAEDFDSGGNDLLRAVGASARFDGRLLRDERNYEQAPALPVADNITGNSSYTEGVEEVTLNYATVVEPNGATVLVGSSEFSYIDANRNEEVDDGEPLDSYPVVTVEEVGAGRVVAVSDPSLFINSMLERGDNRRFAANLFDRERVILDYSHAGGQPPLRVALLTLRDSPLLQSGLLLALIGLLVGATRLFDRTDSSGDTHELDRDRIARYLARERGWDPARIERLTTTVWGRDTEEADNE